jgi:hypothetical protein
MAAYRSKSYSVEAERFKPWLKDLPSCICMCHEQQHRLTHVHARTGVQIAKADDWLVTFEDGSVRVMADKEFVDMFEQAS